MVKFHDATPDAARMSKSLRGLGYSLESAIADLIDNSLEANATEIDLDWKHSDTEGPQNWVRISDNGDSMTATRATEALKYGSPIDKASAEKFAYLDRLSAFGFGLKTASTSQCKKLFLAARQNPDRCVLRLRELDLDHLATTNKWEIAEYTRDEVPTTLYEPLLDRPGTVVLWQNLDRLLAYSDPHGSYARAAVQKKFEKVEKHLGMVFHRYISGTTKNRRRKKVTIRVNGKSVRAWDPLCEAEKYSEPFDEAVFHVPNADKPGMIPVHVNGTVLPRQEQFSSAEAYSWAGDGSGKGWDSNFGFYFYRADRIIDEAGWKGIWKLDPHFALARVTIDFNPGADAEFKLDIAKCQVSIPGRIRPGLKEYAKYVRDAANNKRRIGERKSPPDPPDPPPGHVTTVRAGKVIYQAARKVRKKQDLDIIKKTLRVEDPEVADALGW